MNPTILALDASSTSIGWVVYDGTVLDHGEIVLRGSDIADRCRRAPRATIAWWQAVVWYARCYPGWPALERRGRRRIV